MAENKDQKVKELSLEELLKAQADIAAQIQKQKDSARPAALEKVKKEIELFGFTATELGFNVAAPKAEKPKGTRNMSYPLKSSLDASKVAAWINHIPPFLTEEKCPEEYKAGKSIDKWLVDPSNGKTKAKFLVRLSELTGKAPTKEQIGAVTQEQVEAATKKPKTAKAPAKSKAKA